VKPLLEPCVEEHKTWVQEHGLTALSAYSCPILRRTLSCLRCVKPLLEPGVEEHKTCTLSPGTRLDCTERTLSYIINKPVNQRTRSRALRPIWRHTRYKWHYSRSVSIYSLSKQNNNSIHLKYSLLITFVCKQMFHISEKDRSPGNLKVKCLETTWLPTYYFILLKLKLKLNLST
jgi:hypothetical protein